MLMRLGEGDLGEDLFDAHLALLGGHGGGGGGGGGTAGSPAKKKQQHAKKAHAKGGGGDAAKKRSAGGQPLQRVTAEGAKRRAAAWRADMLQQLVALEAEVDKDEAEFKAKQADLCVRLLPCRCCCCCCRRCCCCCCCCISLTRHPLVPPPHPPPPAPSPPAPAPSAPPPPPPPPPPCSYKMDGEVVAYMRKLEKQRDDEEKVLAH